VLWLKVGLGGATCQAGRPARVAGQPSFLAALNLGITDLLHRPPLTRVWNDFWKYAKLWPVGQGSGVGRPHFGSVGLELCAASSPRVILFVTMYYFGYNKDMHGFWSIWCISIIRCSWNGKSTKLMELISNKHLSSISWMKYRYVWPGGHLSAPIFLCFFTLLCFFPCITVLLKNFSLGAQNHTKWDINICF
jgi:hypothetical protein